MCAFVSCPHAQVQSVGANWKASHAQSQHPAPVPPPTTPPPVPPPPRASWCLLNTCPQKHRADAAAPLALSGSDNSANQFSPGPPPPTGPGTLKQQPFFLEFRIRKLGDVAMSAILQAEHSQTAVVCFSNSYWRDWLCGGPPAPALPPFPVLLPFRVLNRVPSGKKFPRED